MIEDVIALKNYWRMLDALIYIKIWSQNIYSILAQDNSAYYTEYWCFVFILPENYHFTEEVKADKGRKVGDKNTPETFLKISFS